LRRSPRRLIDGPRDYVIAFFAKFARFVSSMARATTSSRSSRSSHASFHRWTVRRRPRVLRCLRDFASSTTARECVSGGLRGFASSTTAASASPAASAASLHPRPPRLRLRGLRGFASSTAAATASPRPSRLRFFDEVRESFFARFAAFAAFASSTLAATRTLRFDDDLRGLLRRAFARSLRR
jgi:hypothetical protein